MTKYGTGQQLCYDLKPCRYYTYLYQPKAKNNLVNVNGQELQTNQNQNKNLKTILITSGIHGNQYIGPMAMLYLYPLLQGNYRIIYFPVMNPSGFSRGSRSTYPNQIDPNRDYPIDQNKRCYQASGTRIIDQIFREYTIHLTINLHNGASQIGWNWGTNAKKYNSHTVQYDIYKDIGNMLHFFGGYNTRLGINQLNIGTMNEAIYPAEGTLDDWAYAGSWDSTAPNSCQKYQFKPYPKNMHNGLVFLFELGKHNAPESTFGTSSGLYKDPISTDTNNGYITRTLRMLSKLVTVVSPQVSMNINFEESQLTIKIIGCKIIEQSNFSIFFGESLIQQYSGKKDEFSTPNMNSFTNFITLKLDYSQQNRQSENIFKIEYSITCDNDWRNKGVTSFAEQRIFTGNLTYENPLGKSTHIINKQNNGENFHQVAGKEFNDEMPWTLIVFIIFLLFFTVIGVLFCCHRKIMSHKGQIIQLPQEHQTTQTQTEEQYQQDSDEQKQNNQAVPQKIQNYQQQNKQIVID